MTAGFGIRQAARPAWRELHEALVRLDRPVPCRSDPDAWTSDDAEQRARASRACSDCPVIVLCDQFARLNRENANVFGGLDRTPRRGRPAATQKVRTTA